MVPVGGDVEPILKPETNVVLSTQPVELSTPQPKTPAAVFWLYVPESVILSMPVILPEAVPLHEVTSVEPDTPAHDVVAAVDDSSSDLLQAPITAIIPTINANQSTIFS